MSNVLVRFPWRLLESRFVSGCATGLLRPANGQLSGSLIGVWSHALMMQIFLHNGRMRYWDQPENRCQIEEARDGASLSLAPWHLPPAGSRRRQADRKKFKIYPIGCDARPIQHI